MYAYTHVSKINYTPQLSIWSPPVSFSPSVSSRYTRWRRNKLWKLLSSVFVFSARVNVISENTVFLERRLTRLSILGRAARPRHGTRRATLPALHWYADYGDAFVQQVSSGEADPTGNQQAERRNGYSSR
jgi:hypothetical protein